MDRTTYYLVLTGMFLLVGGCGLQVFLWFWVDPSTARIIFIASVGMGLLPLVLGAICGYVSDKPSRLSAIDDYQKREIHRLIQLNEELDGQLSEDN